LATRSYATHTKNCPRGKKKSLWNDERRVLERHMNKGLGMGSGGEGQKRRGIGRLADGFQKRVNNNN